MGKYLDLDDLVADNQVAKKELDELRASRAALLDALHEARKEVWLNMGYSHVRKLIDQIDAALARAKEG